jgi:hypothetical protein
MVLGGGGGMALGGGGGMALGGGGGTANILYFIILLVLGELDLILLMYLLYYLCARVYMYVCVFI